MSALSIFSVAISGRNFSENLLKGLYLTANFVYN